MSGDLLSMAEIQAALTSQPIGWRRDKAANVWLPSTAHDDHIYEHNCAVCRAGDFPAALAAVVHRVVNLSVPSEVHP